MSKRLARYSWLSLAKVFISQERAWVLFWFGLGFGIQCCADFAKAVILWQLMKLEHLEVCITDVLLPGSAFIWYFTICNEPREWESVDSFSPEAESDRELISSQSNTEAHTGTTAHYRKESSLHMKVTFFAISPASKVPTLPPGKSLFIDSEIWKLLSYGQLRKLSRRGKEHSEIAFTHIGIACEFPSGQ